MAGVQLLLSVHKLRMNFVLPGVKVASVLVRTRFVSGPNSCAL